MLNSKDPWNQVFALYKIFNTLKVYEQENLDPFDKKLIQGIYQRSQHNYKFLKKKTELDEVKKEPEDWSRGSTFESSDESSANTVKRSVFESAFGGR